MPITFLNAPSQNRRHVCSWRFLPFSLNFWLPTAAALVGIASNVCTCFSLCKHHFRCFSRLSCRPTVAAKVRGRAAHPRARRAARRARAFRSRKIGSARFHGGQAAEILHVDQAESPFTTGNMEEKDLLSTFHLSSVIDYTCSEYCHRQGIALSEAAANLLGARSC